MKRGELWWVHLRQPTGSEPGFRRPAVIVQDNDFTSSRINTVIVAIITSNQLLGGLPGNVQLTKGQAGLDRSSVINVTQLVTLDKGLLVKKVGQLDNPATRQLNDGLRLVLSL